MSKYVVKYNEVDITDNGIIVKKHQKTFKSYETARSFARMLVNCPQYKYVRMEY